jgi:hypothetical protein
MVWDVLYRGSYPGGPSVVPSTADRDAKQDATTLTEADVNTMHLRLAKGAADTAVQEAKERQHQLIKLQAARVAAANAAASRQQRALGVTLNGTTSAAAASHMDRLAEAHSMAIESAQTELWTRLFLHSRSGDALKRLWSLQPASTENARPEEHKLSGARSRWNSGAMQRAVGMQAKNSPGVQDFVTEHVRIHRQIDRKATEALVNRLHPSSKRSTVGIGSPTRRLQ